MKKNCKKLYNMAVAGAYAARRSRMIIRRLLRSSSQVGSTHAENLIRSIGCTDLIADTQAERDKNRGRERFSGRKRFGSRDNHESVGVLISNLRRTGALVIEAIPLYLFVSSRDKSFLWRNIKETRLILNIFPSATIHNFIVRDDTFVCNCNV